jgi:gliding motility-associated-like protein
MRLIQLIITLYVGVVSAQFCPALGPDQILPCGVGSATLTADLSQCGLGNNPNQTTNYTATNIPYVAQTNTGNQLFMIDDSQQGPFNIGFTFCFFGTTYTQFYIGSNGWISFSGGQPTTFTSQTIPTANALVPKNCIMGPWQDWHPGLGGQIRYQVQGVAPCRKLVVSWIGVPMFSCTGNQGTFHIIIHESTNVIENHIANKPACIQWQGGTATQGVHNIAGTIGITVPGRNSTAWTTTDNAWRWTPSGPTVTPTLTWYQVGNPTALGTGPTLTVTPPPGGAQYTCQLTYPTCNAGWSQCNGGTGNGPDTVLVVPGPPIPVIGPINGTDTICIGSALEVYEVMGQPGYNYLWSSVAPILTGQGTNTIEVDFSAFPAGLIPGAIQVTPEANGCVGMPMTYDITIFSVTPVIQPEGPFCSYDEFITLQAQPLGGVFSGVGVLGSTFTPLNAIGTSEITYVYTQSGCVFDTSIFIVVNPQPTLDSITPYNPFIQLCEGDTTTTVFTTTSSLPGYLEWTMLDNITQQQDLPVAWNSPGMFTISVVAYSNGCVSNPQQTVVTVVRCPELLYYIPNSFTPDGNQHNNSWLPVFTSGFDPYSFHVEVYNRWGEMIWESYNHTVSWDGTYNNSPCQAGSYTYILMFGDKQTDAKYTLTGHFNLIR